MSAQHQLFLPDFVVQLAIQGEIARINHQAREDGQLTVPRPLTIAILSTSPAYAPKTPLWDLLRLNAVLHVADEDALYPLLEERPIDFILLDQEYAKTRLLDKIKRVQPDVRFIFLLKEPCPSALIKVAVQGHQFFTLGYQAQPQSIATAFLNKIFLRREPRCELEGITVTFNTETSAEQSHTRSLYDISNNGLTWLTDESDNAKAFLPGMQLHSLRVMHGSELLASVELAQIIHLSAYPLMPLRYRIGAQFLNKPPATPVLAKERFVQESVNIAALLQRGLQHGGIRLSHPYDQTLSYLGCADKTSSISAQAFQLSGVWPDHWQIGTLLRGTFESAGWGYEFLSVIRERNEQQTLTLRTPSLIKGLNRRHTLRHVPTAKAGLSIEFIEPFSCRRVQGQPYDLTIQGVSLTFNQEHGPLPPGTRLATALLHGIEARPIRFSGSVRWTRWIQKEEQLRLHCGIAIENLADNDQVRLSHALVSNKVVGVINGQGMPFLELLDFFRQSNFIYPKKEEALGPRLQEVQNTCAVLIKHPTSPVMRTLVIRSDDDSVDAHISLLHTYTHTWMSQHLSAMGLQKKNRFAGRDINIGILNTTLQLDGFRWLRTFYQPQKNSPDLLLGNFVRRYMNRSQSAYNIYAYLTSNTSLSSELKQEFAIRPATPSDVELLERHYVYRDSLPELLADDITTDEMNLDTISREYRGFGLTRFRRIVAAELRGKVCGVALMEFGSPGLNLSEVTSRCTLHAWDEEPSAVASLAEHARIEYRKRGFPICTVLARPELITPLVTAGFNHSRDYVCSTVGREMISEFIDYMENMFGHHG